MLHDGQIDHEAVETVRAVVDKNTSSTSVVLNRLAKPEIRLNQGEPQIMQTRYCPHANESDIAIVNFETQRVQDRLSHLLVRCMRNSRDVFLSIVVLTQHLRFLRAIYK